MNLKELKITEEDYEFCKSFLEKKKNTQKITEEEIKIIYAEFLIFNKKKKKIDLKNFLSAYMFFESKGMIPNINETIEEEKEENLELSDSFFQKHPNLIQFKNPHSSIEINKIKGQNEAVKLLENYFNGLKAATNRKTKQALLKPDIKFKENTGVLLSYVLAGTSGTGKTELAKQIAKSLGFETYIVNMGQMKTAEDRTNLVGPPPGTSSDNTGGNLTKFIKENPQTIIVLDEMEKADKEILNIFMGILENGSFYDTALREEIKFNKTSMFFTTNAGVENIYNLKEDEQITNHQKEEVKEIVYKEVLNNGLNNLIDGTVVFNVLTKEVIEEIAEGQFKDKIKEVSKMKLINSLKLSKEFKEICIKEGYNIKFGARDLEKKIDKFINLALSDLILQKKLIVPTNLKIDFNVDSKEILILDENNNILNSIGIDGKKDEFEENIDDSFDFEDEEGNIHTVNLNKEIVGQNDLTRIMKEILQKDAANLNQSGKPISSLLVGGPSGVGKTLTFESAAKQTNFKFIDIDMAQHQNLWSLIGPSKGFVGYENGGELPNQIKKITGLTSKKDKNGAFSTKEKFIIEFKNIDLADEETLDIFLNMLDEGYIETPKDGKISMENAIIALTTNQGSESVINGDMKKGRKDLIDNIFKNRPEIKGRIGDSNILVANSLDLSKILYITKKIFKKKIEELSYEQGLNIELNDNVILAASIAGYDKNSGVRKINRIIKNMLETNLSNLDFEFEDKIILDFDINSSFLKISKKDVNGNISLLKEVFVSIGIDNTSGISSNKKSKAELQIEYAQEALKSINNGGKLNYDFIDYLNFIDFIENGKKEELIGRTKINIDDYKLFYDLNIDLEEEEFQKLEEKYFQFYIDNLKIFKPLMKKKNIKEYIHFFHEYKESYENFNIYSYLIEHLEFYNLGIEEIKNMDTKIFKDMKKNHFKKYLGFYLEKEEFQNISFERFNEILPILKRLNQNMDIDNFLLLNRNFEKSKFLISKKSYDNEFREFVKKNSNELVEDVFRLNEIEIQKYEKQFLEAKSQEIGLE